MSATIVFKRVLIYGGFLAVAIGIVGSVLGYLSDGGRGVVSALIGTAMAFVFLGVTAASILIGNRAAKSDMFSAVFFITVLGGWLVKFAVFLVLVVLLKDQPWINNIVLFLSIVAGVIGSLVVDMVVIAMARVPYVSDVRLPGDDQPADPHASA